ncbi:MAG: hypothetical protein ACRDNZ_12950 [Streptosporangiaceae bacterium]
MEIRRLTARLRTLRRFGLDLCLGRLVSAGSPETVYIGRLGLTDKADRRLLLDWRSATAEPFFGATHANPMGLASRRRYRWTSGRISDYWDEVLSVGGLAGHAALDDQSAFMPDDGRDPLVRHLAESWRLGRGVRRTGSRYSAQRGARPDLVGAAHDPGGTRDPGVPADLLRKSLLRNAELRAALNSAWPLLEASDLVADLWSVPA